MQKLGELLRPYEPLFEEFDFLGIDLNFDHYMDIHYGNEDCIFGLYYLMSYNATGHAHIVLIPQINKSVEEWPVAYYDDEHGAAYIFASSIKTWFPAYILYKADLWYSLYLSSGDKYPWVVEIIKNFKENKDKIISFGKKFMNDFDIFFEDFLNMVSDKKELNVLEWYKKVEPDSFLTEYYALQAENASKEKWKEYIFKYPFYNRPLFEALNTEAVELDGEDPELDIDLCYEFWNRALKIDIEFSEVLPAVVKAIIQKVPDWDSPFMPFIKKINKILSKDSFADYHGTEGFFDAGQVFHEKEDFSKAIKCYENSIFFGRFETGVYNEDAYKCIVECSELLGDQNYSAYIEETKEQKVEDEEGEE